MASAMDFRELRYNRKREGSFLIYEAAKEECCDITLKFTKSIMLAIDITEF
ncbi:hypothetical protein J23TS9_27430 [Paenibacillus sp. J23TS9]|nr:hypothetical protein J23TS9_27430 [Paenibacillus sp. J23TS9]